jgi:hypothetical protein
MGNCGCIHKEERGIAEGAAGISFAAILTAVHFFAAKVELFELKGDPPPSPGGSQLLSEAPGGRWREEASTIQGIMA